MRASRKQTTRCFRLIRLASKQEADMIKLKRAYDGVSPSDGPRYLVERLWLAA